MIELLYVVIYNIIIYNNRLVIIVAKGNVL